MSLSHFYFSTRKFSLSVLLEISSLPLTSRTYFWRNNLRNVLKMIAGWITSTASCFTLPPRWSSLSHIPDLNLISLWELESLPPVVWLWSRQAEFSVPGTVVVKSCLMDKRLFCCLGFLGVFFSKCPVNVQEHILELRELTLQRPWCQKDSHVRNIAESQREPRALPVQRIFKKQNEKTSHFFCPAFTKVLIIIFRDLFTTLITQCILYQVLSSSVCIATAVGLVTMLLYQNKGLVLSSYEELCWTVLLTSSKLLAPVRFMALSAAPCTALGIKCSGEESFCCHRQYGMGHQSFSCHYSVLHSRRTKCRLVVCLPAFVSCLTVYFSSPLLLSL